jgi:hypothetical protein
MGQEYQWKFVFYPQTIIHPPILHGSPGKCWLTLQARLVCGLTDHPVTMTGLLLQALRFVVSRAPRSPGAPGHPEPTREGCSLTSLLLWSARNSQDWRALFFPDLRTLKKEESTAIKREGESAAAQTSIALSSILLNWTLRSSSSVVSSCSCRFSPVCVVFSQEPPMISCYFLISFFFNLQPLLF